MDLDAEVPTMFEVMLTSAMESKGTDWDMLAALLKACAEESVLQVRAWPTVLTAARVTGSLMLRCWHGACRLRDLFDATAVAAAPLAES